MQLFGKGIWIGSAPSHELVSWLSDLGYGIPPDLDISLEQMRGGRPSDVTTIDWDKQSTIRFFDSIEHALSAGKVVHATLNASVDQQQQYAMHGNGQKPESHLFLTIGRPLDLKLSNLSVKYLGVNTTAKLHIENCCIAVLSVGQGAEISMERTHVGNLDVHPNALKHYEMRHGSLLNITCPHLAVEIHLRVPSHSRMFFFRASEEYLY